LKQGPETDAPWNKGIEARALKPGLKKNVGKRGRKAGDAVKAAAERSWMRLAKGMPGRGSLS
jgi:hypothetical protein